MRILALDHGTVRIGVAVSDELKMMATPLEFIAAGRGMFVARAVMVQCGAPSTARHVGQPRDPSRAGARRSG